MLPLAKIFPRDIENPEILALIKEYRDQFGEDLVFASLINYRVRGKEAMEQAYRNALEQALHTGTPFKQPDLLTFEEGREQMTAEVLH